MIDGRRSRQRRPKPEGLSAPRQPFWRRIRLGEALVRLGVPADAVTVAGVVLAGGTAVAVGTGQLYVGVALIIVGGLMDALDGAVAKAAGSSSPRGAYFDSVADRVADFLIFGGVAWYFLGRSDPRLALLPLAILGAASLISYQRAKAESLGFDARGGLMERAERLILLGGALFFHVVLVPLLWCLLALCLLTAAGRFRRVWRQASGAPASPPRVFGPGRVESRWRAFREAGSLRPERAARRRARRQGVSLTRRLRSAFESSVTQGARTPSRPARERTIRAFRRRFDDER